MIVQGTFVVSMTSALESHFEVLRHSFFHYYYFMSKRHCQGELSCTGTGLVSVLFSYYNLTINVFHCHTIALETNSIMLAICH